MTDEDKAFDRWVDYTLIPNVKTRSGFNESKRDRRILKNATEVSFVDVTNEPDEGVQTGQISSPKDSNGDV